MAERSIKIPVRKTIVFALISGLILFILFKTLVNVGGFSRTISNINLFYFYLAFATMVPTLFLSSFRWYYIIQASGFRVPFWKIFKTIMGTLSFSVIPGRLGDFARSYPLRHTVPMVKSTGTIVLEKLIDLFVLLVFSAIGFLLLGHILTGVLLAIIALAGMLLFLLINSLGKKIPLGNSIANKIRGAISILSEVKQRKSTLSLAVLSSCANWTMSMFQAYWLFKSAGAGVSLLAVCAFLPLSIFAGLIPFTIAGVGTRDSALIYFFRHFATSGQSLAVGILYSTQTYFAMSVLGIPLLYYFFKHEK